MSSKLISKGDKIAFFKGYNLSVVEVTAIDPDSKKIRVKGYAVIPQDMRQINNGKYITMLDAIMAKNAHGPTENILDIPEHINVLNEEVFAWANEWIELDVANIIKDMPANLSPSDTAKLTELKSKMKSPQSIKLFDLILEGKL